MASMMQTRQLAEEMLTENGLAWDGWTFEFDRSVSRGGLCNYSRQTISLSRHLVPLWTEEQVLNVIAHEVAHALVGPGHGHNHVWEAQVRELGFVPLHAHNYATPPKRWVAYCDHCQVQCGSRHRLAESMRNHGLHSKCRKKIRWIDTTKEKV